ncbi:MAG: peroxiredoxin [Planctomycetaceae bacterium]|nr:peroxiredoxin [Planctomycetaceae bacterium]
MNIGDEAPDFQEITHTGTEISLREFRGKQVVVLFFYPQDGTPVCTREACGFRDAYEEFASAGAVVIGVSRNSQQSHQRFAANYQLPFHLLSDSSGKLRQLFEVPDTWGLIPSRVTFVIDRQGVIRHIFSALLQGEVHVREALSVVRKLQEEAAGEIPADDERTA